MNTVVMRLRLLSIGVGHANRLILVSSALSVWNYAGVRQSAWVALSLKRTKRSPGRGLERARMPQDGRLAY